MKILAFSDLHLSCRHARALVAASDEADLVIGAGDFCNVREGLDQAMALLKDMQAPMLVVPGNCETAEELRAAAQPGTTVLHGAATEVAGLTIYGLGGGIPVTPFGSWSFDLTEAQAVAMLGLCDKADVLITHSPPKGIADVTSTGLSVGSTSIRDAITRLSPRLAVCGHVHDCWGQEGRIGATRVVNLGPSANWFNL